MTANDETIQVPEREGAPRITTQIDELEKETAYHKKQLNRIKSSLRSRDISEDVKVVLKKKLKEMETELILKEKRLSYLHKENKKTTLFAILVFSLAVIVYVVIKSNSDTNKPHS